MSGKTCGATIQDVQAPAEWKLSRAEFDEILADCLKRGKAIRGSDPMKAELYQHIKDIFHIHRVHATEFKKREEEVSRFAQAIKFLVDQMPHEVEILQEEATLRKEAIQKFGPRFEQDYLDLCEDYNAMAALGNALLKVMERGLPRRHFAYVTGPLSAKPDDRRGWNQLAPMLEWQFHACFSGRSKEAGYRFVTALIPYFTGERPTIANVKEWLVTNSKPGR